VITTPAALRGFDLLPHRRMAGRAVAGRTRFRPLVRDGERRLDVLAGSYRVAIAGFELACAAPALWVC
jgi:hypothetical protein